MSQTIQNETRIDSPAVLPYEQIDRNLKNGYHVIVQFSDNTYSDLLLSDINKLCTQYDNNFGVRFYGHYFHDFDCAILAKISKVKCLYIDCLRNAENIHDLKKLKELQKLSIGIFELKETEILDFPNFKNIEDLRVTETKTKTLNLKYLRDYKNLKFLTIGGHSKNIDAVGELATLEYLSLCSIKKVSVSFVNELQKLKTLSFVLGGRENLNEISENKIEHLNIIRVRGFNDLNNIEKFTKLKTLTIEDQLQLNELNFKQKMQNLEELNVFNCKTLQKIEGLLNLPNLYQIRLSNTAIQFTEFIQQKFPKSLKILGFYTRKTKDNAKIKNKIEELGYQPEP